MRGHLTREAHLLVAQLQTGQTRLLDGGLEVLREELALLVKVVARALRKVSVLSSLFTLEGTETKPRRASRGAGY